MKSTSTFLQACKYMTCYKLLLFTIGVRYKLVFTRKYRKSNMINVKNSARKIRMSDSPKLQVFHNIVLIKFLSFQIGMKKVTRIYECK